MIKPDRPELKKKKYHSARRVWTKTVARPGLGKRDDCHRIDNSLILISNTGTASFSDLEGVSLQNLYETSIWVTPKPSASITFDKCGGAAHICTRNSGDSPGVIEIDAVQ
jgi:hypothetical protein